MFPCCKLREKKLFSEKIGQEFFFLAEIIHIFAMYAPRAPSGPEGANSESKMRKEITFDRFVRGFLFIASVVLAVLALNYLSSVLIPFFVAWVVAYLLYPIVTFLQYRCRLRSRLLSIFVTLILVGAVIYGIGYVIVPPMVEEMSHLKEVALRYLRQGAANSTIPSMVQQYVQSHASEFQVEKMLQTGELKDVLEKYVPKMWNVVWSTAGVVISIISSLIGLLYLFFLLTDYEKFSQGWIRFVPARRRRFVSQLVDDVEMGMSRYLRGQVLVALSNCVMFSVGFALIGFPVPLGLGVFIGLISFIPYVQVVGFIPAMLLALLKCADTGENFWWLMGGVLLVYVVVQVIQDAVVTPKVMGKMMGLRPAVILLSLSVWGYLLGIIGLIIALPMTTLIIDYYKQYVVKEDLDSEQ